LRTRTPAQVHHLGDVAEVGFEIVGAGSFVKEDLGEAGGGGLKADLGQLGSMVAAEMIEEVILVEAVLDDEVLFEAPFEITAGPVCTSCQIVETCWRMYFSTSGGMG
jgi:hypothetical protein